MLSVVWLGLIILDLTGNGNSTLSLIATIIWVLFIAEFLVRLAIAPQKRRFLTRNWLTIIALIVPAVRVLSALPGGARLVDAARGAADHRGRHHQPQHERASADASAARGRLYRGADRGGRFRRGGRGCTISSRRASSAAASHSYWDALWWTAMLLTSIGSQYWPQSEEARVLGFLLALYGLGILGYMTATIASFFIGRDADSDEGEVAGNKELKALRCEIAALREAIANGRQLPPAPGPSRKRADA